MKAFPKTSRYDENNGMDLRDYFAAKALQGMLSDHTTQCDYQIGETYDDFIADCTYTAYQFADSMMKARKQK